MKIQLLIIFLQIFNLTSYDNVKEDVEIGLNYFQLENIHIVIKYGKENKVLAGDNFYEIRIKNNLNNSWNRKKVLVHEIVHIQQHYSGQVVFIDDKYIKYKDVRYLRSNKNPPWEIDAIVQTNKILKLK